MESVHGRDYWGDKRVSESGHECMKWSDIDCTKIAVDWPDELASEVLSGEYCRNVAIKWSSAEIVVPTLDRPWCFTSLENYTMEACKIPFCGMLCLIYQFVM